MDTKQLNQIYDTSVIIIMTIVVLLCLIPFLHIASVSLSSNNAIMSDKVTIFPYDLDLTSYRSIFRDKDMIRALAFTIEVTGIYVVISMFMTICAAYPLTKKWLKGRGFFISIIVITMFFQGGIIPDYILMRNLKLINNMWVLILPQMISVFNLIVLKSFLSTIPESILESAYIDGANEISILARIVIPLSTPVLATLSLFYAVTKWNSFQDALFYISEKALFPLQLIIYQIIYLSQAVDMMVQEGANMNTNLLPESLKAASVMFATIPILLVYPWLQKYFMKGATLGSLKG
jgi:putative aldouronate transport system permease protein